MVPPHALERTSSPLCRRRGLAIGMIIPSVNSMTEPQFNRFAPPGLAVHVARARVAGPWKRPLAEWQTRSQRRHGCSPTLRPT